MLQRLKEYIDFKGIKISGFEKSIGMSNASLVKPMRSGGSIGADKLEIIFKVYPDLNPTWLLTGEGEMLNKEKKNYPESGGVSILEEPTAIYEKKVATLEKTVDELNRIIREKEDQLREKDTQISRLILLLEK